MMPFAGIGAILGMLFIAWRLHEWRESRKAKARYDQLEAEANRYCAAWNRALDDYWSRASVQTRGYLLDHQRAKLDYINECCRRVEDEMSECAREF